MDAASIKDKLITILGDIQKKSGLECPALSGEIRPTEILPRFDSKAWPVATTILSIEIGAVIPNEVNIFVEQSKKIPRSIDEIAAFVCQLIAKQIKASVVA